MQKFGLSWICFDQILPFGILARAVGGCRTGEATSKPARPARNRPGQVPRWPVRPCCVRCWRTSQVGFVGVFRRFNTFSFPSLCFLLLCFCSFCCLLWGSWSSSGRRLACMDSIQRFWSLSALGVCLGHRLVFSPEKFELTLIHLSLIACSVHQKQWWLGIHEFGLEM